MTTRRGPSHLRPRLAGVAFLVGQQREAVGPALVNQDPANVTDEELGVPGAVARPVLLTTGCTDPPTTPSLTRPCAAGFTRSEHSRAPFPSPQSLVRPPQVKGPLRRYAPLTSSSQDQTPQLWERRPLRSDAATVVVMATDWDVPVGGLLSRQERMTRYGGARYGGMETSTTSPNVFLYSDPVAAAVHGYSFDGWTEAGSVFLYTGEGATGDQAMRAGNRAVLEASQRGKVLRLFVADGLVKAGSAAKNQRYIGAFETDHESPYLIAETPDRNGEPRTVFVFRLRPTSETYRRDEDTSASDDAPPVAVAELVEPEAHETPSYPTAGTPPSTAERRENELVERYRAWLASRGHTVKRWRIKPPGELQVLLTDIYDIEADELIEAKGTATRDAIRRAIGQLLDYRRHIDRPKVSLAVLVPHAPSTDLGNLLTTLDIDCIYEHTDGGFERLQAG
jgi:hypothetical protein